MRHSSFENDWIAGAPILRLIRFYIGSRHIYMQQAISAAVLLRSGLETLRLEGNPITLEEFCALEGCSTLFAGSSNLFSYSPSQKIMTNVAVFLRGI